MSVVTLPPVRLSVPRRMSSVPVPGVLVTIRSPPVTLKVRLPVTEVMSIVALPLFVIGLVVLGTGYVLLKYFYDEKLAQASYLVGCAATGEALVVDPMLATGGSALSAIALLLEAGAKEVRVFDRSCNDPRLCYRHSGIQEAVETFAKKAGAVDTVRIHHVEDRKFVRTAIPGGMR